MSEENGFLIALAVLVLGFMAAVASIAIFGPDLPGQCIKAGGSWVDGNCFAKGVSK